MNPALDKLLEQTKSENKEVQEEAILAIAMLLEKHSTRADKPSFYKEILPGHLLSITLSEYEQQELIAKLSTLIMSEKMTPSMIWALGKTTLNAALMSLLVLLNDRSCQFDEEATWQLLVAIDNALIIRNNGMLDPQVRSLIRCSNPTPSLRMIAEKGNPRLKKIAQNLLKRVV